MSALVVGWDAATAALTAEWSKLETWIEAQRNSTFTVNGVELSGRHLHWLSTDIGDRVEEMPGEPDPDGETWAAASSALLYCEMLRAMLTGVEVPDPVGMRRAACRAAEVARMLRELVAQLDAAQLCGASAGG